MNVKIHESWKNRLNNEFQRPYFQSLTSFVRSEYETKKVYPKAKDIFNAFKYSPFDQTRVVIIGQDPYHGDGQAHGLCFSVNEGIKPPPSLQNIFKEIQEDIGTPIPTSGNLERWAHQGVLLLNATLTVQAQQPGSHQKKGWEEFTDAVIQLLSDEKENLVFLLWGAYAQKKGAIIDQTKHLVLESAHPSPFAVHRGFFGNKHFSKTNTYLKEKGLPIINW
ncbi:uracil-DNA glycosylase [Reichenbachiella agarivorans]|uniref:Uracil-DNA glycosylase n=1 Tax=Reichenbachiella agarivorans TaxID=2979464 RepID=A0ABY6CMI1_9BACT|nr:uracil-DNA glycosylase [Reichenbachiella agarivorans]UXP31716.1 uracil-DNA glycosylase [Reichenbachiella agarivorans]